MAKFANLESLYFHLESNALDYETPFEIAQLFQVIRDENTSDAKKDVAKKAQLEMEAFSFSLRDGKVEPFYIIPDKNGNNIEYPNLSNYDKDSLDYLVERMESSRNPFLKSRYAHILWGSSIKHGRFAVIAVDSYLELIENYKIEYMNSGNLDDELVEAIKNVYFISKNIKNEAKLSQIKIKIHSLMPIFDEKRRTNFGLWKPLVELMLAEKNVFSKDELIGLDTLCFIMGKYLKTFGNLNFAISIFELGERIEMRIGTATYRWREQIAQCYENLMIYAKDNLIALLQCQKAIDNYNLSKNMAKVDQLKAKYAELKSSINLRCFKYNLDMSDILKCCSDLTDDLLKGDVENIIGFLMNYPNLLPKYQEMNRMAEDHIKKFVFITLFPGSILDDRGHITEHVATSEEHKYHQILFNYNIAINMNTIPMLNSILFKAIPQNKLSLEIFINFFKNYSWYGKNINKNLPNGALIKYNWLNFLIPALHEYFSQINYFFASGNAPSFMLAIDSFNSKIRGFDKRSM